MATRKLTEFLDNNRIKYLTISHSPAYTAQEVAATAHIPGREMAKTVMVKVDGRMEMAVLPASKRLDLDELAEGLHAKRVELAREDEFRKLFPECETGAMPPFGNLYGMETLIADSLTDESEIAFNAGTHSEVVKMSYMDFVDLVRPRVVQFTA